MVRGKYVLYLAEGKPFGIPNYRQQELTRSIEIYYNG